MRRPHILVAGIGNIFLGDDAFGIEVVRQLSSRPLPEGVRVEDFGIRSFDLAYALMDNYDAAILVDATAQGGDPGTVYTIEVESGDDSGQPGPVEMDAHTMNPMRVLEMVRALGGKPGRVLVVGCEPATLGNEFEGAQGLSAPVAAAVNVAAGVVESLVVALATA